MKNFSTYVKEELVGFSDDSFQNIKNIKDPYINIKRFNPFDDVWMYYSDQNIFSGQVIKLYSNFMMKLLKKNKGKYIIFYSGDEINSEIQIKGYLNKVIHSGNGIIYIVLMEDVKKKWGIHIGENMRILDEAPKRITSNLDPYGEEEWDD